MHLILEHISKEIGKRKILEDVSFSVEPGEVFGILGPDGSGKSSLLKIIAGIWRPSGGALSIDGRVFQKTPADLRAAIGYMTFNEGLYEDLSPFENLDYTARLYGLSAREGAERIEWLLEKAGLSPFRDLPVKNFSGGMKQKLSLCCALLHRPKILLLDEPSTGIDPLSRKIFWDLLLDLPEEGVTILVTTPTFDEVRRCGRAALLSEGRLLWTGEPDKKEWETTGFPEDKKEETIDLDLKWVLPRKEGVDPVIRVEGIRKSFKEVEAVKEVSFAVRQGEIFGLIGSNGAGKTTTIRMLCGLIAPDEGAVSLLGEDPHRRREEIGRKIGYMSQKFSLYEDLTAFENILFYGGIYSLPPDVLKKRGEWILQITGLEGQKDRLVREFPTGWRQRLALGCTLVHDPSVLFLDEPTSGVDPVTRRYFWRWIASLAGQGRTMIVTTHSMTEAAECHRLLMMHEGTVLALGAPGEICPAGRPLEDVFVEAIKNYERSPHLRHL